MDSSVDVFAAKVKADPNLANGFNAFGLSQGNNLIRGYIAKYNDPPVNTFMSICGINAGVGAFPDCSPQGKVIGGVCQALTEVLSSLAYNSFVQGLLFQADYFRDPSKTDSDSYKKYSQLAQWENEGNTANATLNENFAKTEQFVWVKGNEDTVVWPREGEWFGAMDPNDPWNTVLPMNQVSRPPPPLRHRCPPTLPSASNVVIVCSGLAGGPAPKCSQRTAHLLTHLPPLPLPDRVVP